MSDNNNKYFSTHDRDYDTHGGHCAELCTGAWWYGACTFSNMNGNYTAPSGTWGAVHWQHWKDLTHLSATRMLIKPR